MFLKIYYIFGRLSSVIWILHFVAAGVLLLVFMMEIYFSYLFELYSSRGATKGVWMLPDGLLGSDYDALCGRSRCCCLKMTQNGILTNPRLTTNEGGILI